MFNSYKKIKNSIVFCFAVFFFLSITSGCATSKKVTRLDSGEVIEMTRDVSPMGVSETINILPFLMSGNSAAKEVALIKNNSYIRLKYMPVITLTGSGKAESVIELAMVEELGKRGIHITPDSIPAARSQALPDGFSNATFLGDANAVGGEIVRYCIRVTVIEYKEKSDNFGSAPVVSVALSVVDIQTGMEIYTTIGTRHGWASATLGSTAKKLVADLAINFKKRFLSVYPLPQMARSDETAQLLRLCHEAWETLAMSSDSSE